MDEEQDAEKYLIFSVLGKLYAFPSRIISEIAVFDRVYPLPLLPGYVLGIINRYSVPYALIDLGLLLRETPTSRSKLLVLKNEADRAAILIDDVVDMVDISPEKLTQIEQDAGERDLAALMDASFIWNEDDVFVLNPGLILKRIAGDAES
jgi:purine-binding chemotaxis protein CheW